MSDSDLLPDELKIKEAIDRLLAAGAVCQYGDVVITDAIPLLLQRLAQLRKERREVFEEFYPWTVNDTRTLRELTWDLIVNNLTDDGAELMDQLQKQLDEARGRK